MPNETTNTLYMTNDFSIVSKYSAVKQGYLADPILEDLVENFLELRAWRRTSLVNRGYAARLLAMRWIVERTIKSESLDTLIVLGGGYDTLPMQPHLQRLRWIDIDLPQVMEKKAKFMVDRGIVPDLKLSGTLYASSSVVLIPCDMRNTDQLASQLHQAFQAIGAARRVAIINEVCLCYLTPLYIKKILRQVLASVEEFALRVHYIGYEQLQPDAASQFTKVMLDHFQSIGHPLKYFPTPTEAKELLSDTLGFQHVTISSMFQIYQNALLETRLETSAFQSDLFDEFEELDLYLGHYALITGLQVLRDPFLSEYQAKDITCIEADSEDIILTSDQFQISLVPSVVRRFGHSSCLIASDSGTASILIAGGFGESCSSLSSDQPNKHKRLSDCVKLTLETSGQIESYPVICSTLDKSVDRMYGQIQSLGEGKLFFNGGRHSPAVLNANDAPYTAIIVDNNLIVDQQLELEEVQSTLRWRHKLSRLLDDEMIQIGGLSNTNQNSQHPIVWNFSSSRAGFSMIENVDDDTFCRHSFGLDMKDNNTVMLFGGLQTHHNLEDRPVSEKLFSVLWDRRTRYLSHPQVPSKRCYDTNIHFISDHEFIRVGGISAETGLSLDEPEVIDLRNNSSRILKTDLVTNVNEPLMLTKATTCHIKDMNMILTIGGGGSYFTFGTQFIKKHFKLKYS